MFDLLQYVKGNGTGICTLADHGDHEEDMEVVIAENVDNEEGNLLSAEITPEVCYILYSVLEFFEECKYCRKKDLAGILRGKLENAFYIIKNHRLLLLQKDGEYSPPTPILVPIEEGLKAEIIQYILANFSNEQGYVNLNLARKTLSKYILDMSVNFR